MGMIPIFIASIDVGCIRLGSTLPARQFDEAARQKSDGARGEMYGDTGAFALSLVAWSEFVLRRFSDGASNFDIFNPASFALVHAAFRVRIKKLPKELAAL